MFALRLFRTSHELIRGGLTLRAPLYFTHCTQCSFKNTRPFTAVAYWEKQSVCSWRTSTVCRREDPAEAPTDQIAAFGRTTAIFFFYSLQTRYTNDSVSVQRVIEDCGWVLVYTYILQTHFQHFSGPWGSALCLVGQSSCPSSSSAVPGRRQRTRVELDLSHTAHNSHGVWSVI